MAPASDHPQLADWVKNKIQELENYNDPLHDGAAQRWRDALHSYEILQDRTALVCLLREERTWVESRFPAAQDTTGDGSVQKEFDDIEDVLDKLD